MDTGERLLMGTVFEGVLKIVLKLIVVMTAQLCTKKH